MVENARPEQLCQLVCLFFRVFLWWRMLAPNMSSGIYIIYLTFEKMMGRGTEAFHDAVERNELGTVAAMLGRDAQHARSCDDEGKSPLHKAAGRGLDAMVVQLLKAGAGEAVNSKDASGNTPLHDAVVRGCVETARILVRNGASADVMNQRGETPRHLVFDEEMERALRPDSGAPEVPARLVARARFKASR